MQYDPLVSVIIPVYNVEPYLKEALDSVLDQSYQNLEIILIDDGSTDRSGKICDDYSETDDRIRVIHQENKGLSSARNKGLDLMHGELVAFLDPDDAYQPDYVRAMLNAMTREQADLVQCRYTNHKTTRKMIRSGRDRIRPCAQQGLYDRRNALRSLADGTIDVFVWNKLYQRRLWKDIRFPEGHNFEDIGITYQIIDACRSIYVLDQPLYLHRKRPDSITDDCSWDNIRDRIIANSRFNSFIQSNIPDIFDKEQLERRKRDLLSRLLILYIQLSWRDLGRKDTPNPELKDSIIKMAGETEPDLRTGLLYRLLMTCPSLIRISYPVYHTVRMFIWQVFGK
ncbi:MAG: glycosyltransferase family 2 protein [Parasporobacterium sp.]|nr:glycosyltransferase family 2 protein [Parasporobacterium sp.]